MNNSGKLGEKSISMDKYISFVKLAQKVSHDLNNTLFPILTGSELLLENQSDKELIRESASDINESVEKSIRILNDFITQIQSIATDFDS